MKLQYALIIFLLSCSTEPEIIKDCAGVENGEAFIDDCEECAGGTTGNVVNYLKDCFGECGGLAQFDGCGVCGGDGASCVNSPNWADCPSCYENTASMTAIVQHAISGAQMYDENDILAAFDYEGNVRGVAVLLYPIPFGPFEGTGLYEIQIRGNEAGDAISFKYYDATADEVLDNGTGYNFIIDDIIGNAITPHSITVNN